jgi:hypothetical protein
MKTKVLGFAAIGIAAITLTAFVHVKGQNAEKKKKYQVIHQKDGVLQEFDTIIPMSSNYSVEDFLQDKGVDNENVEIIKMPSFNDNHFVFHGSDGEEVTISSFMDDMEWEHEGEMVKIIAEEDENGELKVKKFVDGEEVEISEEELQDLKEHKQGHRIVVKEHGDVEENVIIEENGDKIKIIVEEGKGGDKNVKKYVNGEEVEISDDEFERVELEMDGEHIKIEIAGEELSKELEEAMKELKIEMHQLDVDLEKIMEDIDINIEHMTTEEGDREKQKVIIQVEGEMEDLHEEMKELMNDFDHNHFKEMHKDIRIHSDDEDFTLVIVTENLDDEDAIESAIRKEIVVSKDELKLYPNPNEGNFTIEFEQPEKLQTKIEVVNSEGKVVFKEKLGKFSGKYKKELNLKEHGSGTYIVNIHKGDKISKHKIVIE